MKYAITIPWDGRRVNYLKITLATLNTAIGETYPVLKDAPPIILGVNQILASQVPTDIVTLIDSWFYYAHLNNCDGHQTYVEMLNKVFLEGQHDIDCILNIDADAVVHPQLLVAAERMMHDVPDVGCGSFFNESCHPEPQEYLKEDYHVRGHVSFFCSLIRRQAWELFKPPSVGEQFRFGCADGMFSTFVHESTPFKVVSTVRSYCDHLGYGGKHAGEQDGLCTSSRGRRFYSD